jgi:hypothetical protein
LSYHDPDAPPPPESPPPKLLLSVDELELELLSDEDHALEDEDVESDTGIVQ